MTPKEKAEELVDKMLIGFIDWTYSVPIDKNNNHTIFSEAKQRALIAVDEILNNCLFEQYSCGFLILETKHEKYWQEVKEQLITL
jgi:hypothetical protein